MNYDNGWPGGLCVIGVCSYLIVIGKGDLIINSDFTINSNLIINSTLIIKVTS